MARSTRPSAIPAALRQQLEISAALARERLMEVHFRHALELVEHTQDQLAPTRALDIYARLHGLAPGDTDSLHHRVFVALGRRKPRSSARDDGAEESRPADTPRTILGTIRRRLRGRVNTELRVWVEYHTGRAETELLWTHVENALRFIDLFDPATDVGDAVAIYADQLDVPVARTEIIYYLALAHLSTTAPSAATAEVAADDDRPVFTGAVRPTLRIPEKRAGAGGRRRAG